MKIMQLRWQILIKFQIWHFSSNFNKIPDPRPETWVEVGRRSWDQGWINKQAAERVGADEEFGEDMAVGRIGKHTSVIKWFSTQMHNFFCHETELLQQTTLSQVTGDSSQSGMIGKWRICDLAEAGVGDIVAEWTQLATIGVGWDQLGKVRWVMDGSWLSKLEGS